MEQHALKATYSRTSAGSYVYNGLDPDIFPSEIWTERVRSGTITKEDYAVLIELVTPVNFLPVYYLPPSNIGLARTWLNWRAGGAKKAVCWSSFQIILRV